MIKTKGNIKTINCNANNQNSFTERMSQIEQASTEVTPFSPIRDVIVSYLDQDKVYPDPGFLCLSFSAQGQYSIRKRQFSSKPYLVHN